MSKLRRRAQWSALEIAMLLIVITVCSICLIISITEALTVDNLPDEHARLFTGTIGSLIAIVSMWVGAKIENYRYSRENKEKSNGETEVE